MIEKEPSFVECSHCGEDVLLIVWGEGIDSSIECTQCGNKETYR